MGIMSAVMGMFGNSTKAVDTGLDLVKMGAKGVDALFFTDEERTESLIEIAKLKLDFAKLNIEHVKATLGESSARSMSRRYMAWCIMGLGILISLYSLISYTWGNTEVAVFAFELLKVWMPMIIGVGAFYFGVHLVRGMQK